MGSHSHQKSELGCCRGRGPGTSRRTSTSPTSRRCGCASRGAAGAGGGRAGEAGRARSGRTPETAAEVAELQRQLVAKRPERFEVLGPPDKAAAGRASPRASGGGHLGHGGVAPGGGGACLLRAVGELPGGLPAGEVTVEDFYYERFRTRTLVTAELTGAQLTDWVALASPSGGRTASASAVACATRWRTAAGAPAGAEGPLQPGGGLRPLKPEATYRVGDAGLPGVRGLAATRKRCLWRATCVVRS